MRPHRSWLLGVSTPHLRVEGDVTVARIESTGQPAGSIADDREDRRMLHPELRCVRGGWGKALIGGGETEKGGLAIYGRPTTDLLSSWTRLRLRRGVRFTVGGRDAEGIGSRSRAANGPRNGPEVGIVRDREAMEGVQRKVRQQWWGGSGATTEVDRLRIRSRLPEGNRGAHRRIFGSGGATRGGTRRWRGNERSMLQAPVATSDRRIMPMGHFGRAEPACGRRSTSEGISSKQATSNVTRGRQAERCCRPRRKNEPLKGEPHRRYRHETRPEGFREE
jgi:hypothetical protein